MVVLGGVVLGGFLALRGGDDDEARGPAPTTTSTKPVTKVGHELLDRLAKGRQLELHLKLEPDPATPSADGSNVTLELWRNGDLVRQDLVLTGPGVRNEVSSFQRPDGDYYCQKAQDADWVCQATRSTATESGQPAGLVESAAATLAGAEVVATDTTVAGQAARCYDIKGQQGASTLCVSAEGIPLRIGVNSQQLTATTIERSVDPKAFDLPAKPTGA